MNRTRSPARRALFIFLAALIGLGAYAFFDELEQRFGVQARNYARFTSQIFWGVLTRPPGEEELLRLEDKARIAAQKIDFVGIPLWWRVHPSDGVAKNNAKWFQEETTTGFLVKWRSDTFYLTAGHKGLVENPEKVVFGFKDKNGNMVEAADFFYTEILDIWVIRVPNALSVLVRPGELAHDNSDLVLFRSPLFIFCDPALQKLSVHTGFYGGYNFSLFAQPTRLIIKFPGVGAQPGCSGAPVMAMNDGVRVRAMLVASSCWCSCGTAYAIPSSTIIKMINQKFFEDS